MGLKSYLLNALWVEPTPQVIEKNPRLPPMLNLARQDYPETKRKEDQDFLPYDPYVIMDLCWTGYLTIGQVHTGINLMAQATVQGLQIICKNPADQEYIDTWNRMVQINDKAEMMVSNAMVFGRCVNEWGKTYLKVRDPRDFVVEYDNDMHKITEWKQVYNNEFINPSKMEIFLIKRMFSDDLFGISMILPALQTIDDLLEIRKGNRAILKRFRKPFVILKRPENASEYDIADVISTFQHENYDGIYEIPEDWGVEVHGPASVQFKIDELMRMVVDQIYLDLGIPKTLFLAESYRSQTEQHIKLLYERLKPIREKLSTFLKYSYKVHLGVDVDIAFEEIRTENSTVKLNLFQGLLGAYRSLQELQRDFGQVEATPALQPPMSGPEMDPNILPHPTLGNIMPGEVTPEMSQMGIPAAPVLGQEQPQPETMPPEMAMAMPEIGGMIENIKAINENGMAGPPAGMPGQLAPVKQDTPTLDGLLESVMKELDKLIKKGL